MTEAMNPTPWRQAMAIWRQAGRQLSAQEAEVYRERLQTDGIDWIREEMPRWRAVKSKSAIAKDSLALCEALGIGGEP